MFLAADVPWLSFSKFIPEVSKNLLDELLAGCRDRTPAMLTGIPAGILRINSFENRLAALLLNGGSSLMPPREGRMKMDSMKIGVGKKRNAGMLE